MISVAQLSFTHPGDAGGFDDVTFTVPSGVHAALIGDNGVGKTTLLRILAGDLTPDDGQASVSGTWRYMPQEVGFDGPTADIRQLLCRFAAAPLDAIGARMHRAEARLAAGDDEAGFDLADAIGSWGDMGGYELEAVWDVAARTILGTSFAAIAARPATTLSGGERKRLVLEVLLGSDIGTLLLDEPDNYLDIPAKRRLEAQIAASRQTILLVSHDRELLTAAPQRISNPALTGSTPLQAVEDVTGNEQRSRNALARYGLQRAARQPYDTLSGGQKARLEILLLELSGVNLLLLDEPTDNLDLESCRALEHALAGFRGAVLAVSHDRAFLRGMGRHWHVGGDGRVHSIADYDSALVVLTQGLGAAGRGSVRRLG